MAFPFWWLGALTAALFLGAVFVTFWIALRMVSRTTTEIRGSVLPGMVAGFRDWAKPVDVPGGSQRDAPRAGDGGPDYEQPGPSPTTERVRRR